MKKIIRLTESDLTRIVKRVLMEQPIPTPDNIPGMDEVKKCLGTDFFDKLPKECIDAYNEVILNGKTPNPVVEPFLSCGTKLGLNALLLMPKIISCANQVISKP